MKTKAFIIGTTASTIQVTPPNFSYMLSSFFVGNTGTATTDNALLSVEAQTYDSSGSVTGTVNVGYFPQIPGSRPYIEDEPLTTFPASSYIIASASSGSLTFTYNGSYVYYRE